MIPESKICSICKIEKTAAEFSKRDGGRSLRSACKECESRRYQDKYKNRAQERARERFSADPEKERARGREKYHRTKHLNKGAVALRNKEYWKKNKDALKQKAKEYREANKEKIAEKKRRWYESQRDKILSEAKEKRNSISAKRSAHEYYLANKDRFAENLRRRYSEKPEVYSAYRQARRARLAAADGKFTSEDLVALRKKQRGKCACCRVNLKDVGEHVDHIIPLSAGGSNDILNIQLLCPRCNLSKSAKHPVDFMQERGFLL